MSTEFDKVNEIYSGVRRSYWDSASVSTAAGHVVFNMGNWLMRQHPRKRESVAIVVTDSARSESHEINECAKSLAADMTRVDELLSLMSRQEAKLKVYNDELSALVGVPPFSSMKCATGRVELKVNKLDKLVNAHNDSKLRKVFWAEDYRGPVTQSNTVIVSRVTKKRIYVRNIGSQDESVYSRNGRSTWGRPIDVGATFPEGIDVYFENEKGAK